MVPELLVDVALCVEAGISGAVVNVPLCDEELRVEGDNMEGRWKLDIPAPGDVAPSSVVVTTKDADGGAIASVVVDTVLDAFSMRDVPHVADLEGSVGNDTDGFVGVEVDNSVDDDVDHSVGSDILGDPLIGDGIDEVVNNSSSLYQSNLASL